MFLNNLKCQTKNICVPITKCDSPKMNGSVKGYNATFSEMFYFLNQHFAASDGANFNTPTKKVVTIDARSNSS